MSLLQKASIITTPTAYAEDYLYSIKPAQSLGENLDVLPSADSSVGNHYKFSPYGNNTVQYVNGETIITYVDNTSGAFHYFQTSYNLSQNLTVGRKYKVEITFKVNTGSFNWQYYTGTSTISLGTSTNTDFETITYSYTAGHASNTWVRTQNFTSGQIVTVKKITIQEVTDADFDFDRNSTGTRVNEDYLIEDVPYNFVINSEDFSQSTWLKSNVTITSNSIIAPDGTLSGGKILETTGSSNGHFILDSLSLAENITYNFSAFVKKLNRRYVALQNSYNSNNGSIAFFDLDNKTIIYTFSNGDGGRVFSISDAKIESAANGWFRLSANFQSNVSGDSVVPSLVIADSQWSTGFSYNNTYVGDVTKGVYAWGLQIVKGDQPKDYLKTTDRLDIPRIDYTNGEPSILLEPQSANLVTYSNDYTQSSWVKQNFTANSETTTAPDGLPISGYDFGDGFLYIDLPAMVNGASYTNSVYIKANKNATIGLRNGGGGGGTDDTNINLTTSWQRFTGTSTAPDTNIGRFLIDNRASKGFGVSDLEVFVYGAQNEQHSYATSLIHTSGSAVTRSADVANNAGNSDLINSTEGVLYAEIASNDTGAARILSLSDNTTNNSIRFEYSSTVNQVRIRYRNGGATQNDFIHTLSNEEEFNKIAFKYKVNDFSLYVNGTEVATDTSGSVVAANTFTTLKFLRGDNSNDFYGNVKSVMVFKEALTDLELEKLTGYNNHELYMNYYNRLSYLGLVEEYNVESDINNYIL